MQSACAADPGTAGWLDFSKATSLGRAPAAMMASLFGWESAARLATFAVACSCCFDSVHMSCASKAV